MSTSKDEVTAVAADDSDWELEGAEGETLNPDDPEVLAARREAGDSTAPEVTS